MQISLRDIIDIHLILVRFTGCISSYTFSCPTISCTIRNIRVQNVEKHTDSFNMDILDIAIMITANRVLHVNVVSKRYVYKYYK